MKISAIDDVRFDLKNQMINIKNMLLMLDLNANFLFISALNRKRFEFMFSKKVVEIRKKDILIATEFMKDRMYHLQSTNVAFYTSETEKSAPISEKSVEAIFNEFSATISRHLSLQKNQKNFFNQSIRKKMPFDCDMNVWSM